MSGNQDRAAARSRCEALYDELAVELDRAKDVLKATELRAGELVALQRFVRAIDLMAKAGLTVEKMATSPRSGRVAEPDMEQEVADRDDSPEALEAIRSELMGDIDRIHVLLEKKEISGRSYGGGAAPPEDAGLAA